MAGGMDLGAGGRSRRKPLDATINLVPFIDLMAVTISFLIMTAVWTQLSRLQVAQGSSGAQSSSQQLDVTVALRTRGFVLSVDGAAATQGAIAELPRALHALRARFPDERQITVQSDDGVRYEQLISAIDACVGERFDAVSMQPAS